MRVLHVLDTSLPRVAGYSLRTQAILESQVALGLQPSALTGLRQGPASVDCEQVAGIDHHRTPEPDALARVESTRVAREIVEMTALGRRIVAVAREARSELLHAHSPVLCGVPAIATGRRLGLPVVYEVRALWEDAAAEQGRDRAGAARYQAIRALETATARAADSVVVICDGLRRDLIARGLPEERVHVVPNGVDPDRFLPRPRDAALAAELGFEGEIVIAFVGTLFRFEGVSLLLDALARILARRDDVRAVVVGGGEMEAELRAQHERLGLGGRVVLTGRVRPDQVARYYALADVLCYPRTRSRTTELTTPLKPLEAMSMEKAVLVSDVGGLSELVRDGVTGARFKAGNIVDLERALDEVTSDATLRARLGRAARRDVMRARSWRVITALYDEVYASAEERCARRIGARVLRIAA